MKLRWLLLTGLAVLGGCGTAVAALSQGAAEDAFVSTRASIDAEMDKHGARFLEDQRRLSALPIFGPRRGRDAAAFLEDKLPFAEGPHAYPSVLPADLRGRLDAVPLGKWPAAALDIDVSAVDTRWMAGLKDFDQWDPWASPLLAAERPFATYSLPLPSLAEAQRWTKVRLLQGLRGDLAAAGRDVEELARLLISSEVVVVQDIAAGCLRHARRAWEHANEQGMDVGGWVPLDDATLDAYLRASRAYLAYVDVHADPARADPVVTSPEAVVGRCAALQETAAFLVQIEPFAGDLYDEARARIRRLLAKNRDVCRLSILGDAWDNAAQRSLATGVDALCDLESQGAGECVAISIVGHIPGLRDLQVEALATAHPSEWFDRYARAPRP